MDVQPNPRDQTNAERKSADKVKYGNEERPSNNNESKELSSRREGRKYIKTSESHKNTTSEIVAIAVSWILVLVTFPLSILFCFVTIAEFHRAIFFRLGRVRQAARGPGLIWFLPCIDSYSLVDLRTRVEVIPTQEMITKDSVTISVDAVLFYYITGSLHATIQISNVHESTIFIAQTTLRNAVGSKTLHDLLTSREALSEEIGLAVDRATEKWGVRIERVAIKDINLPESLQRSMASEAEAMREARAKIISAEGELLASQALKEASDVMAQNKITLQLRHLQILTSISHERHLKIYFPMPIEMLSTFTETGGGQRKIPGNPDDDNELKSIFTAMFEPLMKNPGEPLTSDGESYMGLDKVNETIYKDFMSIHTDLPDASEEKPNQTQKQQNLSESQTILTDSNSNYHLNSTDGKDSSATGAEPSESKPEPSTDKDVAITATGQDQSEAQPESPASVPGNKNASNTTPQPPEPEPQPQHTSPSRDNVPGTEATQTHRRACK
ncbi:band 7 protein AGAP004871-like isoform X3 [Drosophila montana]|uniref:band 7 protein AGAP004871-like isoform X3 n=1 Tax=Drosophila montana TaxID=40370 RepID=UPI00313CF21D